MLTAERLVFPIREIVMHHWPSDSVRDYAIVELERPESLADDFVPLGFGQEVSFLPGPYQAGIVSAVGEGWVKVWRYVLTGGLWGRWWDFHDYPVTMVRMEQLWDPLAEARLLRRPLTSRELIEGVEMDRAVEEWRRVNDGPA